MSEEKHSSVLVIGGGISGITAAIETAEAGYDVYLVEKNPYLGGRVAQLYKYFPKLCPPYCGLEIFFKRIKSNPRFRYFTNAEIKNVSGSPGNFDVNIEISPRYVNSNCTGCNKCVEACPVERTNDFNYGMDNNKAIYLPHPMAFPMRYVIDPYTCKKSDGCRECADVCPYDAIELDMEPQDVNLKVGSIIVATGWKPYDASKIDNLGYGQYENVITNVMFERLAAPSGPTEGKIVRPDGKPVKNVAFVQCAGSRDENHLPYCSAVCCLASMKQALVLREQNPEANIYIFYIDIRAPGRYEDVYRNADQDENIHFIKGKVAKVEEDATGNLEVTAENAVTSEKITQKVDMVVLATGMQPNTSELKIPGLNVDYDDYGFVVDKEGVYGVGVATNPADVSTCNEDATGSALKAIQVLRR